MDLNKLSALKLGIASPEVIRHVWSHGEVKKPETINYRSQRPERDGLFCERIFGPTKDYECYCGKYKRERFKGIICDRCGVEITRFKVRRERMGHIELASPVSHIWYFKAVPSRMGLVLNLSPKDLEHVLYYAKHIVIFVNEELLNKKINDFEKETEKEIERLQIENKEILQEKKDRIKQLKEGGKSDELKKLEKEFSKEESNLQEIVLIYQEGKTLLGKLKEKNIYSEKEYRSLKETAKILETKGLINSVDTLFKVSMGAIAVKELLAKVDLEKERKQLREAIKKEKDKSSKLGKLVKRLEVIEAFCESKNGPEWMILEVIPVIPPELRPMVQLQGGKFATSDLNDLYRRVINRNNRLKRLMELGAPEVILRNEKRMLQEAVDALLDNGRRGKAVVGSTGRPLKSLSELLKGKQGRFRQNLLGKRVDYSGRSVIVVGPELKIYQCGLPKEMALELFKPFVMRGLVSRNLVNNIKSAKKWIEKLRPEVWDVLEEVIREHPVLLNRAPTLHRLGIQAFEPILVEGKAIQVHPMVCAAFNADFDGDQMAVHVPLSLSAQLEARLLMLSAHNLLLPSNGRPVAIPSQEMVLGLFFMTLENVQENKVISVNFDNPSLSRYYLATNLPDNKSKEPWGKKDDKIYGELLQNIKKNKLKNIKVHYVPAFLSMEELIMAFEEKRVLLHSKIKLGVARGKKTIIVKNVDKEITGVPTLESIKEEIVGATLFEPLYHPVTGQEVIARGKELKEKDFVIIEQMCLREISVVQNKGGIKITKYFAIGFIETTVGRAILNEIIPVELGFYNKNMSKKEVSDLVYECITKLGSKRTIPFLDEIKKMGFEYATRGGISIGINDLVVPVEKENILKQADKEIEIIYDAQKKGSITEEERYEKAIQVWTKANDDLTEKLLASFETFNPVNMMVNSAARGTTTQIRQLSGMRGLTSDATGKIIDLPIKANFREGLTVLEYFISTHGGRKGLADTALRTADAGYLTRKLVDISQDVIVREENCGTNAYVEAEDLIEENETEDKKVIEYLRERIAGRFTAEKILHPETKEVIVKKDHEITTEKAKLIEDLGIKKVKIKSLLTCKTHHGVCIKCYGKSLSTGKLIQIGEAVGIIAAQSIGEPGTQLTLRTFHTGGMHASDTSDITRGLPRIVELFEVRSPKGEAILSEIDGKVTIKIEGQNRTIIVIGEKDEKNYEVIFGAKIIVQDGVKVCIGQSLTEGPLNPNKLLKLKGLVEVQKYILNQVQSVYKDQGVDINDKHIELIVRQMTKRVKVEEVGDTEFLPGTVVEVFKFEKENRRVKELSKKPAKATPVLLGLTRSSLSTDSFLSAASFQETTKVLTDAAVKGQIDHLLGLKENVIIGKLIPAGTGFSKFREMKIQSEESEKKTEEEAAEAAVTVEI